MPPIFRNFAIFRDCFPLVPLARSLVPRVSPVQRCRSSRLREVPLRHRNCPAIFRSFSQLDLTLPDRNTPPPLLPWSAMRSPRLHAEPGPPPPRPVRSAGPCSPGPPYTTRSAGEKEDLCVCLTCAKKCHVGHKLTNPGYTSAFCDCGAGDLGVECTALSEAFRTKKVGPRASRGPLGTRGVGSDVTRGSALCGGPAVRVRAPPHWRSGLALTTQHSPPPPPAHPTPTPAP